MILTLLPPGAATEWCGLACYHETDSPEESDSHGWEVKGFKLARIQRTAATVNDQ